MGIQLIQTTPRSDIGWGVALDEFDDCSAIDKFGYNPDISTAYETIWDGGGVYAYPGSALAMTATSASGATDNGVTILIEGLDTNYDVLTETVTLAGSGTATTSGEFLRVYRAYVTGATAPAGNITIANGGTTYAQITTPYNQTLMAVYTIPKKKKGWLVAVKISTEKQKEIQGRIITRQPGGVFLTKGIIGTFGVPFQRKWVVPLAIPEKTDIEIQAYAGANTSIAAGFEIILQDA